MPLLVLRRPTGLLLVILLGLEPAMAETDRSARFPRRREGGGTRSGCAARLLAPLVPADAPQPLGPVPRLALIEGNTPSPAPLVLRFGTTRLVLPAQPGPALRLVTLPAALPSALASAGWNGLWESYPACEGVEDPVAPPALAHLGGPRVAADPLAGLLSHCGQTLAAATVLGRFGYGHLETQLPAQLMVVCDQPPLPPVGPESSTSSQTSRSAERPARALSPQERQRS